MNIQGENSLALFADCTEGLPDDITPIYEAARYQNIEVIDSLLHEHRLAHGEPEQVSYAICRGFNCSFGNCRCPTIWLCNLPSLRLIGEKNGA